MLHSIAASLAFSARRDGYFLLTPGCTPAYGFSFVSFFHLIGSAL
jgi:hypothetical protein